MWALLLRHPARFWLLFGVFATNVFVFSQFAAPDPDVFFLAGYVPWVLFVGFGVESVAAGLRRLLPARPSVARALAVAGSVALGVWLAGLARESARINDRSADTTANDFGPKRTPSCHPAASSRHRAEPSART
jgi:hypothetical protein